MDYTQESDTYELAGIGVRFVASVIDGVLLAVMVGLVTGLLFKNNFAIATILNFAYYGYFWTQRDGQTIGKQAMDIRIIKVDGSPITWSDALIRYVGYMVSGFVFGLGYIWAFFDENHQAWHDKMAKTYVVTVSEKKKKRVTI